MELNITAPAEKLILKLWESIEKSTIGLFKPWQMKRIANAEAKADQVKMLISAQTKQDIQDLKNGRKYFDIEQAKLLTVSEDTEISTEKMLASNEYVKILCKSHNIANSIKIAMEQLENESESITTEKSINQDWLNEWSEHAGFVSDKDIQSLWGKVLAGEVKKPGSFSLRTMQFLRNLSKDEANLIHKHLNYIITNFIANDINGYTDKQNLSFNNIIKLSEIGVLAPDFMGSLSITFNLTQNNNGKNINTQEYYSWLLIIESDKENMSFNLPVIKPTQLGLELATLGNYLGDETYLDLVAKKILSLNNGLKAYKTKQFIMSGNNISWKEPQEITI